MISGKNAQTKATIVAITPIHITDGGVQEWSKPAILRRVLNPGRYFAADEWCMTERLTPITRTTNKLRGFALEQQGSGGSAPGSVVQGTEPPTG
ncbi:hypothetical protein L1887_12462 [Cichorium endivia]|nr:hypothetical protein L1887_12462 [Cichorium endivia]